MKVGGTIEATYTYDALDRRIGIDDSGTQTWTVYDGKGADAQPYADFNSSGNLTMRYLSGPGVVLGAVVDQLLARTTSGETTNWYLDDNLGSVRDIVSTTGVEQDHIVYDSFGNILTETNATNGDRFKFAGMQYDSTTGQYYDNARDYNSALGRFDSEDPLAFAAHDTNLYRYVDNDPVDLTDPSGDSPFPPLFPPVILPPSFYAYLARDQQRQFDFWNNAYIIELRKYETIAIKIKLQGQSEQRAIEALSKVIRPGLEQALIRHSPMLVKIEIDIGQIVDALIKLHAREQLHAEIASLLREKSVSEGKQFAFAAAMVRANQMRDYYQLMHDKLTPVK